MPEIGVRVNGGPISVWVDCTPEDAQRALLEALRDPVVRALLVGREYERAEWSPPHILNVITRPASKAS